MNSMDPTFLAVLFGKVTLLLAIPLVVAASFRRIEPRWRVLLVRATILAVPCVLAAGLLKPRIHVRAFADPPAAPVSFEAVATASTEKVALLEPKSQAAAISASKPVSWRILALSLWFGVGGILAVRELLRLHRAIRGSSAWQAPQTQIQAEWDGVCADFGVRSTPLRVAASDGSPFLTPGPRSTLVIPASLEDSAHFSQLRHVFRHEAAHLRNGDAFWLPAVRFLSIVVWFHPLAWWLGALHLKACEEAADAEAARRGGIEPYRAALAQLALNLAPVKAPAASFLRLPSVVSRLRAISAHAGLRPPNRGRSLGVGLILAIAGALVGTMGLAQDEDANSPAALLRSVVIPEIEFQRTPLSDAVAFLQAKCQQIDPGRNRINIVVDPKVKPGEISLRLTDVPLGVALAQAARLVGAELRLEQAAVLIVPAVAGQDAADAELTPEEAKALAAQEQKLKIRVPSLEFHDTPLKHAVAFLRQRSAELSPDKKGVNIVIDASVDAEAKITLRLSNAPLAEALRYVALLAGGELQRQPHTLVIRKKPDEAAVGEKLKPAPDPAAEGDEATAKLLKSMVVPAVDFQNVAFIDAIQFLSIKSGELDPAGKGVNFVIGGEGTGADARITLKLSNVPMIEAIRYTTALANAQFQVKRGIVLILPASK